MNMLETIACPYCAQSESSFWAEENGYTAVKCAACGLVFVNPRPSRSTIEESVQSGAHKGEENLLVAAFDLKEAELIAALFQQRLRELYSPRQFRQQPLSWLDIGSGYGQFLMALKATLDTTSVIEGVELCRPKVDKSREQGLTVYESLDEIQRQYDVVSLINVFSHVPDPLELIQEIKTKLVEHGELLLVTGNGGDVLPSEYPGKYYFPEHLIFAGEKHIVGMLRQAGFEIIKMYRYPTFLPKQPRKPASIILVRDTFISAGKYIIKKALKKPIASQSAQSPFRSLWIRARRGE